jgi:capsular polysaccharide transport system ATP-binding protein
MTIEFHNVTKKVRLGPVRVTYEDLNLRVEENTRMAFLGHHSAGLDSLVDLICAADAPDSGYVTRSHSISWAIPGNAFMHRHHSLAANARFIARLYQVEPEPFLATVSEMAQLGEFANTRSDRCPKELLARFVFSVGLCLPFDHYILTAIGAGSKADRPRFAEAVVAAGERAGLLLVTQDLKAAQQVCDQAYVFADGRATYFDNMEAAAEFFGSIASEGDDNDSFFEAEEELQDLVNMDFVP